ncbi:hypothetical protein GQ42DRAFT_164231 [Ramicandelaber brevisporus]|nr:hypothetical protein GQ42DRAFT_164231 [Ramicandelaber brevisporus]
MSAKHLLSDADDRDFGIVTRGRRSRLTAARECAETLAALRSGVMGVVPGVAINQQPPSLTLPPQPMQPPRPAQYYSHHSHHNHQHYRVGSGSVGPSEESGEEAPVFTAPHPSWNPRFPSTATAASTSIPTAFAGVPRVNYREYDTDEDEDTETDEEDISGSGGGGGGSRRSLFGVSAKSNRKSFNVYPQKCEHDGCNAKFKSGWERTSHERDHQTEFQCEQGGKIVVYTRPTTNDMWPCPIPGCDRGPFSSADSAMAHTRVYHNPKRVGIPRYGPNAAKSQKQQKQQQKQQQQRRKSRRIDIDSDTGIAADTTTNSMVSHYGTGIAKISNDGIGASLELTAVANDANAAIVSNDDRAAAAAADNGEIASVFTTLGGDICDVAAMTVAPVSDTAAASTTDTTTAITASLDNFAHSVESSAASTNGSNSSSRFGGSRSSIRDDIPVTSTFRGAVQIFGMCGVQCGYHASTGAFVCYDCRIVPECLATHLSDCHNVSQEAARNTQLPAAIAQYGDDPSANQHSGNPRLAVTFHSNTGYLRSSGHNDVVDGITCSYANCFYSNRDSSGMKKHWMNKHNGLKPLYTPAVLLRYPVSSVSSYYMMIRRYEIIPSDDTNEQSLRLQNEVAPARITRSGYTDAAASSTSQLHQQQPSAVNATAVNATGTTATPIASLDTTVEKTAAGMNTATNTKAPPIVNPNAAPEPPKTTPTTITSHSTNTETTGATQTPASASASASASTTSAISRYTCPAPLVLPKFIPSVLDPLLFTQLDGTGLHFSSVCSAVGRLLTDANALLRKLLYGYVCSSVLQLSGNSSSDLGRHQKGYGPHMSRRCDIELQQFYHHLESAAPQLYSNLVNGTAISTTSLDYVALTSTHHQLQKILIMLIAITAGLPLLSESELASLRIADSNGAIRSIYLHEGFVILLISNSSTSVNARVLPRAVSQLLLDFLVFSRRILMEIEYSRGNSHLVEQLNTMLAPTVANEEAYELFSVSSAMSGLSQQYFGCSLTFDAFQDVCSFWAKHFGISTGQGAVNQQHQQHQQQMTSCSLAVAFQSCRQWHDLLVKHCTSTSPSLNQF